MFWIILALAATIRAVHLALSVHSPFFEPIVLDPRYYHEWALRILDGKSEMPVFYGLPLYPYFLAACYAVFQQSVLAVKIIQSLLGLVTLVLIYRIGKKLWAPSAGLLGMFLGAIYGPLFFHETLFIPEALGIPLYAAAFYFALVCSDKPSIKCGAATGFFCGLAALTKAGIVPFLFLFTLILFLNKTRKAVIASCVVTFLLILAPVTVHNIVRGHDFVPLTAHGGYNFYIGNNPDATGVFSSGNGAVGTNIEYQINDSKNVAEAEMGRELRPSEVSKYWSGKAWEFIRQNPGQALSTFFIKIILFFDGQEISDVQDYQEAGEYNPFLKFPWLNFSVLVALFFAGLAGYREQGKYSKILYAFLLSYILSICTFFINARYRLPLLPVFLSVAGFGLLQFRSALQNQKWGRFLFLGIAMAVGAVLGQFHLVGNDNGAHGYANAADGFLEKKEYAQAISYYEKAIKAEPAYAKAYSGMGQALTQMGRWEEAKKYYEKAIEVNPNDSLTYNNIGMFYDRQERPELAKKYFLKAIEIKPNNSQAHNNLGMVYGKQGQMEKAREEFEVSIKLNPKSVRALTNLGLVLYRSGDKERARQLWKQALDIDPNFSQARQALSISE